MLVLTDLTKTQKNILDCEQSNYYLHIICYKLQSCTQFHKSWSDNRSNFLKMACGRLLDLVQPEVDQYNLPTQKSLPLNQTWSGSDDPLQRYRRFSVAHAHFRHISTSGGSSDDKFRIAHCRFALYALQMTCVDPRSSTHLGLQAVFIAQSSQPFSRNFAAIVLLFIAKFPQCPNLRLNFWVHYRDFGVC